ncbi:MAG TPA: hypothetical protein VFV67_13295 [Actinophytocola sp.]|uniref:hypothetical protein n=1 Tax=Actinophytocola sp. TaxID=1872138 RepID=UPI002DBB1E85|nr:hypothetical protein [Actinophytocola sp.]HEU5471623.1 hypothetical protein [Actinophytocola sp.]
MTAPGENDDFDPSAAAALLQQTTHRVRRSTAVRTPVVYAGWGVAWLVGLGGMWLSVRDQRPYHGPATAPTVVLGVLLAAALALTMVVVLRPTRGISGQSEAQGRIFGLAWLCGFVLVFTLMDALGRLGADPAVLGTVGGAAPMLVTSLSYLVGAAAWLDRAMLTMGLWLALVTAVGVYTGPVTLLFIAATAGGGGFLLMAGFLWWRSRS